MEDFGVHLRKLRQSAGWRQQDLADRLGEGAARTTIANVEAGRQRPSEKLWLAIQTACPDWVDHLARAYEASRSATDSRRGPIDELVAAFGGVPSGPRGGPFVVESMRYVYVFRHSWAPEEIIEHRRVRALRSGADGYGLRLFRGNAGSDGIFDVEFEPLWGGRISQETLPNEDGYPVVAQRFEFDHRLRRNEVHDFALRSWITKDPVPATAVTFEFTIPAREGSIQLHFLGPDQPRAFWTYSHPREVVDARESL